MAIKTLCRFAVTMTLAVALPGAAMAISPSEPGCHGGWDWGIAQMTVGFCGKVALLGAKAARIDYVYCDQDFAPDFSSVKVTPNGKTHTLTIPVRSVRVCR